MIFTGAREYPTHPPIKGITIKRDIAKYFEKGVT
jgi:hypothetical protein